MLIEALDYTRIGWHVFPIQPKSKIPFGGTHGHKDASTNPTVIHQWASKYGECNLGLATGKPSSCWVWDVDPRNGGDISLRDAEEKHGKLPDTLISHTPGGGVHYLFAMPKDGGDIPCTSNALPGCDVKGTGGYVVIPPSVGANGREYAWEGGDPPWILPPQPAPEWLVTLARSGRSTVQPPTPGAQQAPVKHTTIERVPEGSRHAVLLRHLGALRHVGGCEEELRSAAYALNQRFEPPFSKGEIEYQVTWAMTHWEPDTPMEQYQTAPTDEWTWHPVALKDILTTQLPPVKWLIPGLLAKGCVGFIGSPPKLGKSWLSLHLLLCLASGKAFLGMPEFLCGCFRGLYISEEDPERMVFSRAQRLWAGLNPSVSPDGQMRTVVKSGFRLDKPECLKTLEQYIASEALDIVILDVFNRLHTKDGNKAEEIIPLLAALDGIRTRTGCTILIDTHFKKGLGDDAGSQGQRMSGTVGLHGWSENSIYLDWPKAQGGQAILNFESKDFAPHDPIVFSIATHPNSDEEDDACPLILSGKPLADGTKRGSANRRAALLTLGVAWEKAGRPEQGVQLSDILPLLVHPMSETTLRQHLIRGGAISQKIDVERSHVWMFKPVSESESVTNS